MVILISVLVVILIVFLLSMFIIRSKKKKNYSRVKVMNGKTASQDNNTGNLDLLDFESKDQETALLNGNQQDVWVSLVDTNNPSRKYGFYLSDYVIVGREELKGSRGYCILDQKLSRKHCKFSIDSDDVVWLEDMGSTNHTYVNGLQLMQKTYLNQGDRITMGGSEYIFSSESI